MPTTGGQRWLLLHLLLLAIGIYAWTMFRNRRAGVPSPVPVAGSVALLSEVALEEKRVAKQKELNKVLSTLNKEQLRLYYLASESEAQKKLLKSYQVLAEAYSKQEKAIQEIYEQRQQQGKLVLIDYVNSTGGNLKVENSTLSVMSVLRVEERDVDEEVGPEKLTEDVGNKLGRVGKEKRSSGEQVKTTKGDTIEKVDATNANYGSPLKPPVPKPNSVKTNRKKTHKQSVLIDQDKNEYVLSKSKDPSKQQVDLRLLMDLSLVVIASTVAGMMASAAGQSVLLGYMVGGLMIGPGGLRLIRQFVQIETLAQLGSNFVVFTSGVRISSQTNGARGDLLWALLLTVTQTLALGFVAYCIFAGSSIPGLHNTNTMQFIFIGAGLAISSNTFVQSSMSRLKAGKARVAHVRGGQLVMSLLTSQTIVFLVALVFSPLCRQLHDDAFQLTIAEFIPRLTATAILALLSRRAWGSLLRLLCETGHTDLFLLGLVGMCFFLSLLTNSLLSSTAVGAFLAGVLIRHDPRWDDGHHSLSSKVAQVLSIMTFFSCLYPNMTDVGGVSFAVYMFSARGGCIYKHNILSKILFF